MLSGDSAGQPGTGDKTGSCGASDDCVRDNAGGGAVVHVVWTLVKSMLLLSAPPRTTLNVYGHLYEESKDEIANRLEMHPRTGTAP